MTTDTSISIALIMSMISIICTFINTFSGQKKLQKEQIQSENQRQMEIEKNFVKISVKLDEFHETTKSMIADNTEKTEQLRKVSEQMVLMSERINTLFKYKDLHENRINALEEKVK